MVEQHASSCSPEQVTQDQRGHDRIVQGPSDRDELRYQVDRRRDLNDREHQPELGAARHPRIAQEAAEEHQQVGDQRRELPRLRSPSKEDQDNDGEQPNREGDADGCQKTAHSALNLTARTDVPRTLFQHAVEMPRWRRPSVASSSCLGR